MLRGNKTSFRFRTPHLRAPHLRPGGATARTRKPENLSFAHGDTVSATAIPLRKPNPGRRAEDLNAHLVGLKFCAHVGVDFAAKNNFFDRRSNAAIDRSRVGCGYSIGRPASQSRLRQARGCPLGGRRSRSDPRGGPVPRLGLN